MPSTLTPGRYRGLKTCSLAEANVFGIIAFDQRGSYRKMMPPDASYEQLVQVKTEIIGALSQDASAILTDPIYGLTPAMAMSPKAGLAARLGEERLQWRFELPQDRSYSKLDAGEDP